MPRPTVPRILAALLAGACAAAAPIALAADSSELVAVVSSKAADSYSRSRKADGSYQTEYYSFADGGHWTGNVSDPSVDKIPFMDVARTMAIPLAKQGYMPARDPRDTRLLVVLYWGRTRTPEHSNESAVTRELQDAQNPAAATKAQSSHQFYNATSGIAPAPGGSYAPCIRVTASEQQDPTAGDNAMAGALALSAAAERTRDQTDAANAALLGYDSWLNSTVGYEGTPLEQRRQDMLDELEHDRYFVVLMAYDFQKMWKEKKHVLLWETRFSVRQRGVEFDKALPQLAQSASRYFGQDSHGLIRDDLPAGRVDVGQIQTLGVVASASK